VVKNGDAFGCYAGAVWSRAVFRNNLIIGGPGGTWGGRVLDLADDDATCSFDCDGLASTAGTLPAQQVDLSVFSHAVPFRATRFHPRPMSTWRSRRVRSSINGAPVLLAALLWRRRRCGHSSREVEFVGDDAKSQRAVSSQEHEFCVLDVSLATAAVRSPRETHRLRCRGRRALRFVGGGPAQSRSST
jgi:hypothetical protein